MPDVTTDGDRWSVLVPVKRLDVAKTRLDLPDDGRTELALAMARDTVRAARASTQVAEVLVITSDRRAAASLATLGARVVDDTPDRGLNPALHHGATLAVSARLVALASDLPALRPADLDGVLVLASEHRLSMVSDTSGSGTTALTAVSHDEFLPTFGAGSRAAHLQSGAVDLSTSAGRSIRQDVDTLEGLYAAAEIGLGPDSTVVLERLGAR
jgi:2-phospho-L-lactate/phosphoenolpyruvate guanylyltransferase